MAVACAVRNRRRFHLDSVPGEFRQSFDDNGLGCVAVSPEDLTLMESTDDPKQIQAIVERVILADRATKEKVPS
jgi:hypothetical protein